MPSPRPRARMSGRSIALVALVVTVATLYAVFVPVHAALYGTPLPLAFLLGVAVCGAPLLALVRPWTSVVVFCLGAFASPLVVQAWGGESAPWPWSVPALLSFIVFIGVVTGVHGVRRGTVPLVVGSAGALAALLLRPDVLALPGVGASATADLIVTSSLAFAALLVALLIASRVRVGAELVREREHSAVEESRRTLVEERTRIARELHDVIAHSMSVIQVQASTARYRLPTLDDTTAAEFDDIAATARSSLTEMRRMLGVLRTEDQTAELAPQNGIDDIPALVDTMRRAGAEIDLSTPGAGSAVRVPAAVQIAAYRIVQESLSNAVRHAPGARITVQVAQADSAVRIEVRNDVSTPSAGASVGRSAGHGLRGMSERAGLLDGTLTAGIGPDGDWTVDALLPLDPDDGAPRATASASPEDS